MDDLRESSRTFNCSKCGEKPLDCECLELEMDDLEDD